MASRVAHKRLAKEYQAIQRNPPPYIVAKPLESNILEWHFVFRGPHNTPYEGGEYHGKVVWPPDYPYAPGSLQMRTPSGRFETNSSICTTMSNFHPNLWNPSWSVSTVLTGLLSFMCEDETGTGSIRATAHERRTLAAQSHDFNLKDPVFREVFPELCTPGLAPLPSLDVISKMGNELATSEPSAESASNGDASKRSSVAAASATPTPPVAARAQTPADILLQSARPKPAAAPSATQSPSSAAKPLGKAGGGNSLQSRMLARRQKAAAIAAADSDDTNDSANFSDGPPPSSDSSDLTSTTASSFATGLSTSTSETQQNQHQRQNSEGASTAAVTATITTTAATTTTAAVTATAAASNVPTPVVQTVQTVQTAVGAGRTTVVAGMDAEQSKKWLAILLVVAVFIIQRFFLN